ncbi:hypothetical protein SY83_13610 [Paenibacillus swuensis]|uniref:Metallo-beta-lactamase domain-containing protein n=1 Tax=Paenibacillus swuensis TaxID=1178515 RepID=A0A172TJ86_9BACL|nr:MBL fold metallo-hydrolase [Paenibacillus swuensis]ANE47125.1 hypothetical protein SY83_13610 [Paenibacillus swuensis]
MADENNLNYGEIRRLKVPLPFSLRYVNSYIIRDVPAEDADSADRYTVIDPGLHTSDAVQVWTETLEAWGIAFDQIRQILLTHYHPDHYGLAGWMQQQAGGVPVRLSRLGHEHAVRLWGDGHAEYANELRQLYLSHGLDVSLADLMVPHMNGFVPQVSPQPVITYMEEGEQLTFGGRTYNLLHTPGHAWGHLCFHDEAGKTIFCGDQVLPLITPNVSLLPGSDPNPLNSFMISLQDLEQLDVEQAYPGHRDPFRTWHERVRELLTHHEERLTYIEEHLIAPMTGYELCRLMFGESLTVHQLRFAMSETLAHLVYLRELKRVVESQTENGVTYFHRQPLY